ncbi:MAG: alpha-ketoacid dehydrogenase subunit beta [Verrucomicrobiota bacterium JB022]|nr:alpha-ketoacid dehydrogenase subunit beta [Verrucomicrobiota bacterium JB022]
MAVITYRQAIKDALAEEIMRDENVFVMGEEVAQYNGAYKVTEGLWARFGDKRLVDAPISEAGFIGLGIGSAMMGLRPVIEMMFFSFVYVAWDQAVNNASSLRYMSGGKINVPLVIRGPANGGTNVGATHSHTPENLVANFPGLKVVCPATPADAKGLMKAAIRDNDPVFVMESTVLYGMEGEVPDDEDFIVPLGKADVKREGKDLTIVAHGRSVLMALEAAKELSEKHKIEVEVVDLRSIRPLDEETIIKSVKKTGRALLVEENKPYCGIGAQISHLIQRRCFDYLDAPVHRISAVDAPAFYSPPVEKVQLPEAPIIIREALDMLNVKR